MFGGSIMIGRSLIASIFLGLLTVGARSAPGDVDHPPRHDGYIPWHGEGFGPVYLAGASTGPQQQQAQVYDISPAMGQAAFAQAEFDNRWAGLQVLLDRARKDFQISAEYLAARNDYDAAQRSYDAAVDSVMARLSSDPQYKDLLEKRTEEQIALKSTAIGTGLRYVVATETMRYGSMATRLEAVALANDPAVQDARMRLVSAHATLSLKEKQFESQLYHRPEVVAARQQMETARVNKAGAEGYLLGAQITRADQLNLDWQSYSGNNVYLSGFDPYYQGYFGIRAY
jgi:hypothetical protein